MLNLHCLTIRQYITVYVKLESDTYGSNSHILKTKKKYTLSDIDAKKRFIRRTYSLEAKLHYHTPASNVINCIDDVA